MGHMMGGPAVKAMNFKGSLRRLVTRLRGERRLVSAAVMLGTVSVALSVVGPKVLGHATDLIFTGLIGERLPAGVTKAQAVAQLRATGQARIADMVSAMDVVPGRGVDFGAVGYVLHVVLALYIAASVLSWVQGRVATVIVQNAVYEMRAEVGAKFSRMPLSYFDSKPRGELLSRVTNDIDNVAQSMQQTLSQLLTSLLTVIGVIAMMVYVSPVLSLVALVTVPVSMFITLTIAKRSKPQFVGQWSTTGKLNGHVEEAYTGHELVKVFGRSVESVESFRVLNEQLYASSFKAQFISGLIQPAMMFVANLNYVAIAVIGGLRVASGSISLGDVQAFIQYSRQFTQPLTQVASMANLLQSGVASAERVFEILDAPEQSADASPAVTPAQVSGRVAFEDVSFSYDPSRPLIEHLDLVAEPGQTIAIVGPTGAGKTTLANLLLRFYDVDAGRITLDGVDVRDMRREDLRAQFGMVLQDTWLFGGTILENIAYGADDASPARISAAAEAAYVDHFVRTLPDGYDTLIDDDGASVSAGQRQLLTIARAFLADPAILILDEATSSVDTRTEAMVQRAMAALRTGRTSFVIAHRLSTIRDADRIVVMVGGAIVEHGTHAQLLADGGAYYRLYAAQFSGAIVDEDIDATAAAQPVG
ncbi:MAG: ABC transporter ATP-binding protein [Phycicoccus sp.]|nr:ABC transporter ATP-binding protein [Phycicoccus sp.]